MRRVICHYHIYKNSGTTFDSILEKNFAHGHRAFDGPFPFFSIDQEQLLRIVERFGEAKAFSSHQTYLPVPVSMDIDFIPVIFLRHPILRVQSIYKFKRKHYDGTPLSQAARNKNFPDWLAHARLSVADFGVVSNAQTRMVGGTFRNRSLVRHREGYIECDLLQAIRNLEAVHCLGRTEAFEEDVAYFGEYLTAQGFDVDFSNVKAKNTTTDFSRPIDERLAEIEDILGRDEYERLCAANEQDLALYDAAVGQIERRRSVKPVGVRPPNISEALREMERGWIEIRDGVDPAAQRPKDDGAQAAKDASKDDVPAKRAPAASRPAGVREDPDEPVPEKPTGPARPDGLWAQLDDEQRARYKARWKANRTAREKAAKADADDTDGPAKS